jgi:hypothetical protein
MAEAQEARRGRHGEDTQGRRERRRKEGQEGLDGLKLPIPEWVFDKYPEGSFVHRWFRAEKGRIYSKTQADDWDPVDGVDHVPGAHDQHGNAVDHVLCVKYRDWWEADRAKADVRRRETEDQMRRGVVAGKGDDAGEAGLTSEISYASGLNRLR